MSESYCLVHSHHLLDHKPDNLLLKGGKYKLRGVACLGRPGVALCIGPRVAIDNFRISMESAMPQKKFGTIELTPVPSTKVLGIKGFESATLGQLRKILADIGHEDQFFALTGIDPSNENNNAKSAAKGSGSGKGKKKKKK